MAAPFSHRTHLKLKLPCVACHSAATQSTQVSDNLLPAQAFCATCHKDERPIKSPRASLVARFSHQQHLKLGNVAPLLAKAIDSRQYLSPPGDMREWLDTKNPCAACHRGLEESDQVSEAYFPRMADCLVCHKKIEPPYSCETCHTDVKSLTPATHDAKWVDVHTDSKIGKQSCAVCHGRRFTCQGCH